MIKTYLPPTFDLIFFVILLILLIFKLFLSIIILILLYSALGFIWRKASNYNLDESDDSKPGIMSPINGRITIITGPLSDEDFGENIWMVEIKLPWWKEKGIYLPIQSEIEVDNFPEKQQLFFKPKSDDKIALRFSKSQILPRLWIRSGDRGKTGANIGFVPTGGTVFLYLSGNYEILLNNGDEIIAGKTLLAMRQD